MGKQKTTIEVPVFGQLHHVQSDLWQRGVEVTMFGRTMKLRLLVDIDDEERVHSNQIRAFEDFSKRQDEMLRIAERAMLKYYQSVCDEYRGRFGVTDQHDDRVPIVSNLKEFAKLVTPTDLTFPYATSRTTIGLLCDCTWEREHGLAVKFEEGHVSEVGFQDIVL